MYENYGDERSRRPDELWGVNSEQIWPPASEPLSIAAAPASALVPRVPFHPYFGLRDRRFGATFTIVFAILAVLVFLALAAQGI